MRRLSWTPKAALVAAATVSICAAALAQEADAPCEKGNLKENYLGKTCSVGSVLFKFSSEYEGMNEPNPKEIMVTPVPAPIAGLRFAFPNLNVKVDTLVKFKAAFVEGIGAPLTGSVLAGDLKNGVFLTVSMLAPKTSERPPEPAFLQLNGPPVNSMGGEFRVPAAKVKDVQYSVSIIADDAETNFQPTFVSTFGVAKKDADSSSAPELDPSP